MEKRSLPINGFIGWNTWKSTVNRVRIINRSPFVLLQEGLRWFVTIINSNTATRFTGRRITLNNFLKIGWKFTRIPLFFEPPPDAPEFWPGLEFDGPGFWLSNGGRSVSWAGGVGTARRLRFRIKLFCWRIKLYDRRRWWYARLTKTSIQVKKITKKAINPRKMNSVTWSGSSQLLTAFGPGKVKSSRQRSGNA